MALFFNGRTLNFSLPTAPRTAPEQKVKPFTLCPDVNYSADGKNYFIFYNNNLTTLKEIFKFKLEELIEKNSWVMDYDSKSLKSTFESDNYI